MSSGGWVIHWARPTYFTDGVRRKTLQFTDSTFGEGYRSSKSAKDCAREAVWDYFRHCFEANRVQQFSGLGPLTQVGELGEMSYHGDRVKREFSVHSWEAGVDAFGVREFNHDIETFLLPGEFCTNCEAVGHRGRVAIWRCRGHDEGADRPEGFPGRPAKSSSRSSAD